MEATKATKGKVRVAVPGVQTLDDTRKQKASIVYRQQHKQIVPSATVTHNTNTATLFLLHHNITDVTWDVEAFTLVIVVV